MTLAAVGASIDHLLLPRRPAAVTRFVIAVVIDPIQSEGVRTGSHVGEKVFELLPATANGDAASAIAHPVGARGTRAPSHHVPPGVVRATAAARCVSVAARHTRS